MLQENYTTYHSVPKNPDVIQRITRNIPRYFPQSSVSRDLLRGKKGFHNQINLKNAAAYFILLLEF